MTIFASSAARFLLQAVAAHDTVIMRQVPPVRTWFEQIVFVASGISTLLVLVLVTGLVMAMFAVRRSVQRAHEALDRRIADFGKRVDDFNELLGQGPAPRGDGRGCRREGDGRNRGMGWREDRRETRGEGRRVDRRAIRGAVAPPPPERTRRARRPAERSSGQRPTRPRSSRARKPPIDTHDR